MNLSAEVQMTILSLFAALAVASVLSVTVPVIRCSKDYAEIRSRIRTWWVIVGLFCLTLYWSVTACITFLGFVSFLALKEFLSMTPTRRADRRVLFYAYVAVAFQYYLAATAWYELFVVFIPVLMFVWLPTRMWMMGQTDGFLRAAGSLHWALMLTVFSLSHAAYLLVIVPSDSSRVVANLPNGDVASADALMTVGPALLLFLIVVTELNDIFQYLWGKSLGKRKVAPSVSPGKTYAGLIGGVATTIAFAALLGPWLTLMDLPRAVLAGGIIGLAGFAGDLCMSSMKRDLKIKDFGATLPGHGGVLDRVDSLIFTAPLFFYFIQYCYGK